MAAKTFTVKFQKSKGRRIEFTVETQGLTFSNTIVVGTETLMALAEQGAIATREGNSSDLGVAAGIKQIRMFIGSANYDNLQALFSRDNETLAEDNESLNNLNTLVLEEIAPKVRASVEKASGAQ